MDLTSSYILQSTFYNFGNRRGTRCQIRVVLCNEDPSGRVIAIIGKEDLAFLYWGALNQDKLLPLLRDNGSSFF